jgi:hypothetical protein
MTRRAPNLTPVRIEFIVGLIRNWEGRLTWKGLIEMIRAKSHVTYTRQSLHNHHEIRIAYETYGPAEALGSGSGGRPISASLRASSDRVARLESEIVELKIKESLLIEQFVRWTYNASTRGLTEDFLNQALPPTNRHGDAVSRSRT